MIPGLGQVQLDVIQEADLSKMFGWRNHHEIWQWCRQESLISWEQHMNWFMSLEARTDVKMFAIRKRSNHEIVGVCGLTDINRTHQRAEFSCYIGPEHQRMGYARMALFDLFSHGFSAMNLNTIWGETFAGNGAAKCFENLGMKHEGTRRNFYFKGGRFIDADLYSVTRAEWHS